LQRYFNITVMTCEGQYPLGSTRYYFSFKTDLTSQLFVLFCPGSLPAMAISTNRGVCTKLGDPGAITYSTMWDEPRGAKPSGSVLRGCPSASQPCRGVPYSLKVLYANGDNCDAGKQNSFAIEIPCDEHGTRPVCRFVAHARGAPAPLPNPSSPPRRAVAIPPAFCLNPLPSPFSSSPFPIASFPLGCPRSLCMGIAQYAPPVLTKKNLARARSISLPSHFVVPASPRIYHPSPTSPPLPRPSPCGHCSLRRLTLSWTRKPA